jgi:4-hydroxy-3-methylbut-2-enyl diphosphate reductase
MKVTIDPNAGFCFGVVRAIGIVDDELSSNIDLYCLGHIVHNSEEVARLKKNGLKTIDVDEMEKLNDTKVVIRAHGEPLSTYTLAKEHNIEIIDATCPIVIRLQKMIKEQYEEIRGLAGQIVIFGKPNHPEVIGLNGQTNNTSIIISDKEDIEKIDLMKPVRLFAQTTRDKDSYKDISEEIKRRKEKLGLNTDYDYKVFDTICSKVSNRSKQIKIFAEENDVIIFVSDQKSSNGKYLYQIAKSVNPRSFFISRKEEIEREWFMKNDRVGISGATSTPEWLMKDVAGMIRGIED